MLKKKLKNAQDLVVLWNERVKRDKLEFLYSSCKPHEEVVTLHAGHIFCKTCNVHVTHQSWTQSMCHFLGWCDVYHINKDLASRTSITDTPVSEGFIQVDLQHLITGYVGYHPGMTFRSSENLDELLKRGFAVYDPHVRQIQKVFASDGKNQDVLLNVQKLYDWMHTFWLFPSRHATGPSGACLYPHHCGGGVVLLTLRSYDCRQRAIET